MRNRSDIAAPLLGIVEVIRRKIKELGVGGRTLLRATQMVTDAHISSFFWKKVTVVAIGTGFDTSYLDTL